MELRRVSRLIALLAALCAASGSAWAEKCAFPAASGIGGTGAPASDSGIGGTGSPVAGTVTLVEGKVRAQGTGEARLLAQGDPVCAGEIITTARAGFVQIRMLDEGLVAIRPQSRLKIEKFSYATAQADASLLELLSGAIRMVTGKIGKSHPESDVVRTPSATIGVRGTDHEITVILPGRGGQYPAGVYDKVNQGVTFISNARGEIDIHPTQVGYAAGPHQPPRLLDKLPEFYHYSYPPMEPGASAAPEHGREQGAEEHKAEGAESHAPEPEAAEKAERPDVLDISDEEDAINTLEGFDLPETLEPYEH